MSRQKIIRDPIFDYISIDLERDQYILDLLDTKEMQRLRRTHQLGLSSLTYPGAGHSRLSHSLGVFHLMQTALSHLDPQIKTEYGSDFSLVRSALLAVALLHDVGHGPFSHVLEEFIDRKHEKWSAEIILDNRTEVNRVLRRKVHRSLPARVVALLEKDTAKCSTWEISLISSQLDMDRLDFLLRDSYFTGAGYGHFDWYRLIHTMQLGPQAHQGHKCILWPEKTKYALEEYVFARFYMYQAVYFHHCTRGYEKLLQAALRRAQQEGHAKHLKEPLKSMLTPGARMSLRNYLRLTEAIVLSQLEAWAKFSRDPVLRDLCQRFLNRRGFTAIVAPESDRSVIGPTEGFLAGEERLIPWHKAHAYIRSKGLESDYYLLEDDGKMGIYSPYDPEKELGEQGYMQAILLDVGETRPKEISEHLERVKYISGKKFHHVRWYCPKEHETEVKRILLGT